MKGKKAVVITRDTYADGSLNFQMPYLQAVFEFIDITDVAFIYAENLAIGTEEQQPAIATAHQAIHQVIANWHPDYSHTSHC